MCLPQKYYTILYYTILTCNFLNILSCLSISLKSFMENLYLLDKNLSLNNFINNSIKNFLLKELKLWRKNKK